LSDEGVSLPMR